MNLLVALGLQKRKDVVVCRFKRRSVRAVSQTWREPKAAYAVVDDGKRTEMM
ncbi:hypothetical protein ACNKHM_21095 [Shigella sonnei]